MNSQQVQPAKIILSTLNARYTHASLGLRYLFANLGELQGDAVIDEFVIGTKPEAVVEKLLGRRPILVGFGVYIWNVEEVTKVVAMLKAIAPEVKVVLGGPEVSFPADLPAVAQVADYVITGQADLSFAKLARQLLNGPQPLQKLIASEGFELDSLKLPYDFYNAEDIAQRTIYVEASRGCPFKCEFCLSSLDKTATPFDLEKFLDSLESLYLRGVRTFKFVDRTFNLNVKTSQRILTFFLEKLAACPEDPVFAHFELVPDHLPEALRETIQKFPPGTLQFEIGIQTFSEETQKLISRRQNNDKAAQNIRWLVENSHAHLHVDLIAGLPGESLESFGTGLNRLYGYGPHEIQIGVLKRLRGTPIIRHTESYQMRYNPHPPYNVLSTNAITFIQMQQIQRFARYWDLVVNSGRFQNTLPLLLGDQPFERFFRFSDWLYYKTDATHNIALERLFDLVHEFLSQNLIRPTRNTRSSKPPFAEGCPDDINLEAVRAAILKDYTASKAKGRLSFMQRGLSMVSPTVREPGDSARSRRESYTATYKAATPKRQMRFLG